MPVLIIEDAPEAAIILVKGVREKLVDTDLAGGSRTVFEKSELRLRAPLQRVLLVSPQ